MTLFVRRSGTPGENRSEGGRPPTSADDLDLGAAPRPGRAEFERERTAWGTADTVTVAALGGIACGMALLRSLIG